MTDQRLCMLGCGNLGTPILSTLLSSPQKGQFTHYTACIASPSSEARLTTLFARPISSGTLSIARETRHVRAAISDAHVVILAVDPSQVEALVADEEIKAAFHCLPSSASDNNNNQRGGKLVISIIAGLSVARLTSLLTPSSPSSPLPNSISTQHLSILRALPNVCAQVSHSLTAIELPAASSPFPTHHLETAMSLFNQIGQTQVVPAALMPAATAVSGSTPAFWGVIVDALVDAGVAAGMPRDIAQKMICTSMRGSAEMMMMREGGGGGLQPSGLRDIGTSPAGCTIAGIMVLEEMGVRGAVGKALRESVRVAKEMGKVQDNHEQPEK